MSTSSVPGTEHERQPAVASSGWRHRLRSLIGLEPLRPDRPTHGVEVLHSVEPDVPSTTGYDAALLRRIRRLGATGTILMGVAALGAGALPVLQNPVQGLRVLGLPARMPTVSLTVAITGTALLVIAWLMLGRFTVGTEADGRPRHRLTVRQFHHTFILWVTPLIFVPPMFSKDVYSYLAQSEIAVRGLDPYAVGPAGALGVDNVLTRTVPTIWRETPAPYGPLFVWLGEGIGRIVGDNIIAGVLLHRLLALCGVALAVWALPRLARRCGVSAVSALWLGAANPLVILHLVAGIHNEALMLGLALTGMELCLRALDRVGPAGSGPGGRAGPWTPGTIALLVAGAVVISLSAAIKIPSLLTLGFVGVALARKLGGSLRDLVLSAVALATIAGTVMLGVSLASGLGIGWTGTLGTANAVRSWMSLPTLLGLAAGQGGVLLGLGDHTTAVLSLTRPIAAAIAGFIVIRMLMAVLVGRLDPVGALGVSLGFVVLLFPVVQPWYLLWAVMPLAAWATRPMFRIPTIAVSAIVGMILMPNGGEYPPFVIVQAALACIATIAIIALLTRRLLPWPPLPFGGSRRPHRESTAPTGDGSDAPPGGERTPGRPGSTDLRIPSSREPRS